MTPSSAPIVSVVMAVYNYGRYIDDALDSLEQQTLREWECVVVDDASTDETVQRVEQRMAGNDRLKLVRLDQRSGPGAARNEGLLHVSGRYIQWLDADDRLEPDKLSLHAKFLDEHPDTDIVYGSARYFREERLEGRLVSKRGIRRTSWIRPIEGDGHAVLKHLLESNIMPINASLTRRGILTSAHPFDEDVRSGEDFLLWIVLAAAGATFSYCDADGARALIRVHGKNTSADRVLYVRSLAQAARRYEERLSGELPPLFEASLAAEQAVGGNRIAAARRFFTSAAHARSRFLTLKYLLFGIGSLVLPRTPLLVLFTAPVPEWIDRLRGQ